MTISIDFLNVIHSKQINFLYWCSNKQAAWLVSQLWFPVSFFSSCFLHQCVSLISFLTHTFVLLTADLLDKINITALSCFGFSPSVTYMGQKRPMYYCACYSSEVTGKFHSSSWLMFPEKHVYFWEVCMHLAPQCLTAPPAGMIDRFIDLLINRRSALSAVINVLVV